PTSPVFGQSVQFTAAVSTGVAGGTGTPSATVDFFVDGADQGHTSLESNGQATLTLNTLSVTTTTTGPHTITARYNGDANFQSGGSGSLLQSISKADVQLGTLSPSPATPVFGQAITFTTQVTTTIPETVNPTGTVTFYDGVSPLGTGTFNPANG